MWSFEDRSLGGNEADTENIRGDMQGKGSMGRGRKKWRIVMQGSSRDDEDGRDGMEVPAKAGESESKESKNPTQRRPQRSLRPFGTKHPQGRPS